MTHSLVLIDYGSGNVHSAARAVNAAADLAGQDVRVSLTQNIAEIAAADRIILPGVGHFGDCARNLRAVEGLVDAMEAAVLRRAVPFLGICVGMQLLSSVGLEGGETPGLNWIPGRVEHLPQAKGLRIPHMGWNAIAPTGAHPVLANLGDDPHAYFVHSWAMTPDAPDHVQATTQYGTQVTAAIGRDNIFGTQFHPEKSQRVGLQILANFLTWRP